MGLARTYADFDFFFVILADVRVASAVIYTRATFLVCCIFPWGILLLQSDGTLSCDHGLDCAR